LVKLLYNTGHCTECVIHKASRFYDYSEWFDDGSDGCQFVSTLELVAFRFAVEKKTFAWHVPKNSVNFAYHETESPANYSPPDSLKEVPLDRGKFREAYELIQPELCTAPDGLAAG
jgi:hypothetical protein